MAESDYSPMVRNIRWVEDGVTHEMRVLTGSRLLPLTEVRCVDGWWQNVTIKPGRSIPDEVTAAVRGLSLAAAHRVADNMLGPILEFEQEPCYVKWEADLFGAPKRSWLSRLFG